MACIVGDTNDELRQSAIDHVLASPLYPYVVSTEVMNAGEAEANTSIVPSAEKRLFT